MKRLLTALIAMALSLPAIASMPGAKDKPDENPTNWETGYNVGIYLSQIGLKNWSAGGDPSISAIINGSYNAKFAKGRHVWEARMSGEWGMQKIKGQDFRKNADQLAAGTKYGFQIDKVVQDEEGKDLPGKWYLTFLAGMKSQFTKTWKFDDNDERDGTISRFLSPMTVEYSLGIDYKPNPHFSLFMSPIAAKHIIVKSDRIAALNLHGNNGSNIESFFGASVIAAYNQQVYPKPANRVAPEDGGDANAVFLESRLSLFKDYLNGPAENIDVDWQSAIKVKVARYISASVFLHLIWDWDVDTDSDTDGVQRAVQFKDVIGVGIAYTIGGKKPNLNK